MKIVNKTTILHIQMKRKRECLLDKQITLGKSTPYNGDALEKLSSMLNSNNEECPVHFLQIVEFVVTNISELHIYQPIITIVRNKMVNFRDYYMSCYRELEDEIINSEEIPLYYDTWLQVLIL